MTIDWRVLNARIDAETYQNERLARLATIAAARAYFNGEHRKPLKVAPGAKDHNVIVNLCRSLINKSVAWLFGDPDDGEMLRMTVRAPKRASDAMHDEAAAADNAPDQATSAGDSIESRAEDYLLDVWRKNGGVRLLQRMGRAASIAGHGFVKLIPVGDEANPLPVPRIVVQPSDLVSVLRREDDREIAEAYVIEWMEKRVVRGELMDVKVRQLFALTADQGWMLVTFNDTGNADDGGPRWIVEVEEAAWPHAWPPIIDWQNLPSDDGYYGLSDLEDLTGLNDAINFAASNVNKIIYFNGHPRTIGTGFEAKELQDTAVEAFWTIKNSEAKVFNLEMQGELQSSYAFLNFLQQSFWDIGRELDVTTLRDRIGQITNFGLKVLASAALHKLGEKRLSYGDAIQRINHALLALGSYPEFETTLQWHNPLPENDTEEVDRLAKEREIGIVSKQTAAKERNRDWDDERERMAEEDAAGGNIGERLLTAFERGQGSSAPSHSPIMRVAGAGDSSITLNDLQAPARGVPNGMLP